MYIHNEIQGVAIWKEPISPKRDREAKFTVSVNAWRRRAEETSLNAAEIRAENTFPHNESGKTLFPSKKKQRNRKSVQMRKASVFSYDNARVFSCKGNALRCLRGKEVWKKRWKEQNQAFASGSVRGVRIADQTVQSAPYPESRKGIRIRFL